MIIDPSFFSLESVILSKIDQEGRRESDHRPTTVSFAADFFSKT